VTGGGRKGGISKDRGRGDRGVLTERGKKGSKRQILCEKAYWNLEGGNLKTEIMCEQRESAYGCEWDSYNGGGNKRGKTLGRGRVRGMGSYGLGGVRNILYLTSSEQLSNLQLKSKLNEQLAVCGRKCSNRGTTVDWGDKLQAGGSPQVSMAHQHSSGEIWKTALGILL